MFAYKCIVCYDGSRYNGWQRQGNTSNTIQEKLETTLSKLIEETIEIQGAGRTDMGVHALGQVIHFHCKADIEMLFGLEIFLQKLNGFLPKDIRIVEISPCDIRFHARLNAKGKIYKYQIDMSSYGNVFLRTTANHISDKLDVAAMKKAANYLIGEHDFKSFTTNKRMKKSSVRTIYDISFEEDTKRELLTIRFNGNGFLYNMVRIIVGTLIEVGLGQREASLIPDILKVCDRSAAGHTAMPQGLFLEKVLY